MRKPSRQMPQNSPEPMTRAGGLILVSIGFVFVVFVSNYPGGLMVLAVCIATISLVTIIANQNKRDRLGHLALDRQGESICTFARSFDCRAVDTWIIRAVFEALQPYCQYDRSTLPLRSTDKFQDDLRIDSEDLDDMVIEIAARTGRSLDHCHKNPFFDNVTNVSDLIMFLVNQPTLQVV